MSNEEKLVGAFRSVRDIPYGGKNTKDPVQVLEQRQGTGSGKHQVLKHLIEKLGYPVRECLAKHDFGNYPLNTWPDALKEFQGKHITGYHDFLQVKIHDAWISVDATFDKPLEKLGLPVGTWDGKTDMKLAVAADEVIPVEQGSVSELRKSLIKSLPEPEQEDRKKLLQAMKGWIAGARTGV